MSLSSSFLKFQYFLFSYRNYTDLVRQNGGVIFVALEHCPDCLLDVKFDTTTVLYISNPGRYIKLEKCAYGDISAKLCCFLAYFATLLSENIQ